jgi:hypothetical protein
MGQAAWQNRQNVRLVTVVADGADFVLMRRLSNYVGC